MRLPAILLLLAGILLMAIARHLLRRARKLRTQNPNQRTIRLRLTGWTLTLLAFLAILLGVTLW